MSHAAHELVEGVEHMIEEEHELDRVAQQAARERAEAEKAGQRATGRVGWGDLRGDLGKRSSGEEAEERRTSGRSSGDEVKAPRRRVGRGAMTASLMKKRPSKAESADYNPNPNPNPIGLWLTLWLWLTLMLTLTITLTLTISLTPTPTLTLTIEGGVGEAAHWRWSRHREG